VEGIVAPKFLRRSHFTARAGRLTFAILATFAAPLFLFFELRAELPFRLPSHFAF
jgi:hypothetical protein